MIMEAFFDLVDIKNRINNDKEYQLVSRFWSANIRFKVEDEFYFMEIAEGKVQKFYRGTSGFDPYDIHIGGPKDVWLKMLVLPLILDLFTRNKIYRTFVCKF